MPNGFHGSKETWQHLDQLLTDADELLSGIAESRGMQLLRNSRGWPERSLRWGTEVNRKFQIYLAEEKSEMFTVGVVAWKDGAQGRAWRQKILRESQPWVAIREELAVLIEEGVRLVDGWGESDLKLVGRSGS